MRRHSVLKALIVAVVAAIFIFCGCSNFFMSEIDTHDESEPTVFTVTYMDGTEVLFTRQVEENSLAKNETLPDKDGYHFVCWNLNGKNYDFSTPVKSNLVLSAYWSAVFNTVSFVADGKTVATVNYSKTDQTIDEPTVPEKFGYIGAWESYQLNGANLTVNAVYTPIEYTVNFYDGNTLLYTLTYTVENKSITEPAVPAKPNKTGVWSHYELNGGNMNVYAHYDDVKYTVTFVADGLTVAEYEYVAENPEVTPPPVPEKAGFAGEWEEFELNGENVTVNAVYTAIPDKNQILTDGNGLKFQKIDNGYSVTGATDGVTEIVVPASFNGLPVLTITERAFQARTDIARVTLPDTVTEICKSAFDGCSFTEIELPESLQIIGDYAFYGCAHLLRADVPDSVKTIGVMAYGGCTSLRTVTIGADVNKIAKYAFTGCPSIANVTFNSKGNWLVSDTLASTSGTVVTISTDTLALAVIKKYSDKYLIKI